MNHQAINSALDFLPEAHDSRAIALAKRIVREVTGLVAGARAGHAAYRTYRQLRAGGVSTETAARKAIETLR
jgi:hypothetical protein